MSLIRSRWAVSGLLRLCGGASGKRSLTVAFRRHYTYQERIART